ncbi:MAG: hypothetical protein JRN10_04600 [Nitrososphaerota archaeon]|nr:hypothetical protein [Nitrososphaerota archaeon]
MMLTESNFKLIMKVMGGNLVSLDPEIYAVWTRGCRDPTRYLFTYVKDDNTRPVFDGIRLKFAHDLHVAVSEKSITVNGKSYNIGSSDNPDQDILKLFMELVRKHENLI